MNRILFAALAALIMACGEATYPEDNAPLEYEMNLTSAQLKEELRRSEYLDDDNYCNAKCRTLYVPRDSAEEKTWSKVSLCRIDICHSTNACYKNMNGLKERIGNCNENYKPSDVEKEVSVIEPEQIIEPDTVEVDTVETDSVDVDIENEVDEGDSISTVPTSP